MTNSKIDKSEPSKRILFLGRTIDWSLSILGIALILTGFARIFKVYEAPFSIAQVLQTILGLIFFFCGVTRKITNNLEKYIKNPNFKRFIALFPFLSFIFFFIYRIQLKDLKAYGRLVEEGSLIEWFSFIFLLLSAYLFFITAKNEIRKLSSRFMFGVSGVTFCLAMEEVSWGQMIFNWDSPDFLLRTNAQQEINFHNLNFLSGTPNTLIIALTLSTLTCLCLLRLYLDKLKKIKLNTIADVIFPSFFLAGYFFVGAIIYICLFLQLKGTVIPILIPRDQEVFECLFALGILLHSCKTYLNWEPKEVKNI